MSGTGRAEHDPVAVTPRGSVRGVARPGSLAFRGIPFALPPVGAHRFQAPVEYPAWTGVRDATRYGPTPQRGDGTGMTLIPEPSVPGDGTLTVNVFTPELAPDQPMPVVVWIHGGGFVSGSPASPWYDGAAFNRDKVVLVSVSYRLGFDGFGWIEDAPPNRAVHDWVAALRWVNECISAFGGDPARVTVAGQSAGGAAVLTLLGVEQARGLFARAICLSAPAFDSAPGRAEERGRDLAAMAGVVPTVAGWSAVTVPELLHLQGRMFGSGQGDPAWDTAAFITGGLPWVPWHDGALVTGGVTSAVPLMLGSTDHEFTAAYAADPELRDVVPAEVLRHAGVPDDAARRYLAASSGDPMQAIGQFASDRIFRSPAYEVAARRAAAGSPTWLYRFAWKSPAFAAAVHCLDVPFFFDLLDAPGTGAVIGMAPPAALADQMHGAAVRFACHGTADWPSYTVADPAVRVFDVAPRVIRDDGTALRTLLPSGFLGR